jgi:hypothetical protein
MVAAGLAEIISEIGPAFCRLGHRCRSGASEVCSNKIIFSFAKFETAAAQSGQALPVEPTINSYLIV